jgi:hypothetical protein
MTPQQFWTWFQQNAQSLYMLTSLPISEQQTLYNQLFYHLELVNPDLGMVINFPKNFERNAILTITAYGVKRLFPTVIKLVKAAPTIDNWKIEAFMQPYKYSTEDVPYKFENIEINLKDLRFKPVKYIKRNGKVFINIYFDHNLVTSIHPDEKEPNSFTNIDLRPYFITILEALLGEMVLYSRIKNFKIYRRYNKNEVTYKLIHLQTYLDLTHQN